MTGIAGTREFSQRVFPKTLRKREKHRSCQNEIVQKVLWQHRLSYLLSNKNPRKGHERYNRDTAWRHIAGTPGLEKYVVSPDTEILLSYLRRQSKSVLKQLTQKYQVETGSQATAEDLRPEQQNRRRVGDWFGRTDSAFQRFHVHSYGSWRVLKVYVCDSLETAPTHNGS